MADITLTKPGTVKQAYSALEAVMQEVVLAEEETLQAICNRLGSLKDPAAVKIIGILQDWGKVPAAELKARALKL